MKSSSEGDPSSGERLSGPWVEGEEERWREEDVMGGEMEGRHKFERFCFP